MSDGAIAAAVVVPMLVVAAAGVALYSWHRRKRVDKAMEYLGSGRDVQLVGRPFNMYDRV